MGITNIDKNFMQRKECHLENLTLYQVPNENLALYGLSYDQNDKCFVRMPRNVAEKVSIGVDYCNRLSAGGRIRFSTDSEEFYLSVKYKELSNSANSSRTGSAGFSLIEETDGMNAYVGRLFPDCDENEKFERQIGLNGKKMRDYILHFPTYAQIENVTLGFEKNSTVKPGIKYKDVKPIVYYGSSITQWGCASRPDTAYTQLISKWNNVDYVNLGFSGSAKGEQEIVDYVCTLDASVFVLDYDHNAPTVEHLKSTHFNFYQAYRKAHPTTPIIFVSKPNYDVDTNAEIRFNVIKETFDTAIKNGDDNVYIIHGKELFGDEDRECCFVDGCHPNDLGFYRMAKVFNKIIQPLLK